jgi:hypothetical protein
MDMSTVYRLKLTCKEATYLSSKKEEGKLTFFLQLRLLMHYISCPPCRRFINQCKLLAKKIRRYPEGLSEGPAHQLPAEKKQSLQEQIDKLS